MRQLIEVGAPGKTVHARYLPSEVCADDRAGEGGSASMARKAALDICASCPFSPFIVVLTFIIVEKMRRGALHVGGMAEQSEQEGLCEGGGEVGGG